MKKLVLRRAAVGPSGRAYRIDYAKELNAAQYAAVMHDKGPALVLAGAGTGKTRTLTYRVARLVEDGTDPASVLLLTFTRKAAREMLRRAGSLLDGRCDTVAGGTFHALANLVLRRYGATSSIGLASNFTVLDQGDAEDVMNLVRTSFDVAKLKKRFPQKNTLLAMYGRSVNTGQPLADVIAEKYPSFIDETDRIAAIVRGYNDYKRRGAMVDYDDLLLYLLALTRHEEIGPVLRQRYKYIMVDEYQDTNVLQHNIVLGLSGPDGNVMAVGDDAQSIYAFRGADVRNIHRFPEQYPTATIIRLEENYRSIQPILDVANAVLQDAPFMFDKELRSTRGDGEKPMLISCTDERQQSRFVVERILEMRESGTPLSKIAVLFRSGFLSFDLEIELGKANIPFKKFGGLRFAEAAHIKDVLALLRLTVNPRDAVSWYRMILALEGVGQKTAAVVVEAIRDAEDALHPKVSLTGKAAASVMSLLDTIRTASTYTTAGERVDNLVAWYKPVCERQHDDPQRRWKDVESLVAICARYGSTSEFLTDIALDPPTTSIEDIDPDDHEQEFVTLSTIHSAKGLEWGNVFLIWANEGTLPAARSADSEESLEEERRLVYVAVTRAADDLYITYPTVILERERTDVLGRPSRFLDAVSRDICPTFLLDEGESEDSA